MDQTSVQAPWVIALSGEGDSQAAAAALYPVAARVIGGARRERGIRAPRYVGLLGRRWDADTELDLAHEFFCHVLEHEAELRARAREGTLGESYLGRMAGNFLVDRQRAVDPVASAGFRRVRGSIRRQIEEGALRRLDAGDGLDKHTRLELPRVRIGSAADVHALRGAFDCYPEREALRKQFTRRGHKETRPLHGLWAHLADQHVRSFLFGDLMDVLLEKPAGGDVDVALIERSDRAESDPFATARERIHASNRSASRKALLLEFLDRLQDPLARSGSSEGWEFQAAEVGRSMGLVRQRAHDLLRDLRAILGPLAREVGIDPDGRGDRPSAAP